VLGTPPNHDTKKGIKKGDDLKYDIEQDDVTQAVDLRDIDPSPYQHRKNFDSDKLKELAASIRRDGLISPILVRSVGQDSCHL